MALEHGEELKASAFTPERWASYCHDITYFLDRLSIRAITTNFFVDHGYNPPPTWTLVGGNLAFLVPVERLKAICNVDVVLVVIMFVTIGLVFGIDALLFALLFYAVTFSGRWPILTQALMRFDWVAAVACGMALLKAQRHGLAGACMAYAALNRIFPSIFLLGWGLNFAFDTWEASHDPAPPSSVPRGRRHRHRGVAGGRAAAVRAVDLRHQRPQPADAQRDLQLPPGGVGGHPGVPRGDHPGSDPGQRRDLPQGAADPRDAVAPAPGGPRDHRVHRACTPTATGARTGS